MAEPRQDQQTSRPTRLVLVRHAVTAETGTVLTGRTPGVSLSEEGRGQASALAERLEPLRPNALYASPIDRTAETAAIVGARLGVEVRELPGVVEADMGKWTGQRLSDLARTEEWKVVQAAPSRFRFPGGESFPEIHARMVGALDQVVAEHPAETAVVVSHSDPICVALSHYAGAHLDHFQRFHVAPASATIVDVHAHGCRLVRVNHTGTLSDLAPPASEEVAP